ncbi:MAG: hypothetical protein ACQGVC_06530 [Myxococcota bacterium]
MSGPPLQFVNRNETAIEFKLGFRADRLGSPFLKYYAADIRSAHPRHSGWDLERVYDTYARFYAPANCFDGPGRLCRNAVIVLNGLDEIIERRSASDLRHERVYHNLAQELAKMGIATVFLATPFHLWRAALKKKRGRNVPVEARKPSDVLLGFPPRSRGGEKPRFWLFYMNFDAVLKEIEFFAGAIRDQPQGSRRVSSAIHDETRGLFRHVFSPEVSVSVMGFSMGGLEALNAFMRIPSKINGRCVLLNSGAGIHSISPPGMGEDRDRMWQGAADGLRGFKTRERLRLLEKAAPVLSGLSTASRGLTDLVLFGGEDEFRYYQERWNRDLPERILALTGAADSVMPTEAVFQRLQPLRFRHAIGLDTGSAGGDGPRLGGGLPPGINLIQLAGLNHILENDQQWRNWFSPVVSFIGAFIDDSDKIMLSDEDVWMVLAFADLIASSNPPVKRLFPDRKFARWADPVKEGVYAPAPPQDPGAPDRWKYLLHQSYHYAMGRWGNTDFRKWQGSRKRSGDFPEFIRKGVRDRFDGGAESELKLLGRARALKFPIPTMTLSEFVGMRSAEDLEHGHLFPSG